MLKNICRNYWITLFNEARRVAEGRFGAALTPKQINSFKQHLDEAKRRFAVTQSWAKEDMLKEQLFMGVRVSDPHLGARLLELVEENIKEGSLLPTTAHVLVQIDVWLQKPQKDTLVDSLLTELWRINYDLPDSSHSAPKELSTNN